MRTFLVAAVAVAVSGAAFAKDLKGSVMSDSEMDKVTAGGVPAFPGEGVATACGAKGGICEVPVFPPVPRSGVCTTGASGRCGGAP